MDKFEEAEAEGRNLFERWAEGQQDITIVEFNENKYGHWDVAFYSAGTPVIGEIKYRKNHSTDWTEWILEKYKYEKLKQYHQQKNVEIMYINITTDGILYLWDLATVNKGESKLWWLPSTTVKNGLNKRKEVYFLPSIKAIRGNIYNE